MKKRSLFPILLIGFTLGLTSCNEDSKKEDITTNPFANLPADSGQKPTTEQMDAAIANFVDNVAIPTYAELVNKMTLLKMQSTNSLQVELKPTLKMLVMPGEMPVSLGKKAKHFCLELPTKKL